MMYNSVFGLAVKSILNIQLIIVMIDYIESVFLRICNVNNDFRFYFVWIV